MLSIPKAWQVGIALVIGVLGFSMAAIFIRLLMTAAKSYFLYI